MEAGRSNTADYLTYVALRLVIIAVQTTPLRWCDRGARAVAWLFAKVIRARSNLVHENLQTAFPNWNFQKREDAILKMWHHLFLMVTEIAHTPRKINRTNWRSHCQLVNENTIVRSILKDGPTVFISGHYGNFELGGYLLGLFGFPTHTVARTIDNPYVDRFINDFRGRTGQFMLPKQGSRDQIEALMERGGSLTLLGDQSAGPKGCWVDFFNRPASTHKAVSLFTLTYNAPTITIGVRRQDAPLKYQISATSLLDPNAKDYTPQTTTQVTEWFTKELEEIIRDGPEQYWWVHRRWKGKPPKRRARKLKMTADSSLSKDKAEQN